MPLGKRLFGVGGQGRGVLGRDNRQVDLDGRAGSRRLGRAGGRLGVRGRRAALGVRGGPAANGSAAMMTIPITSRAITTAIAI